LNSLQQQKKGNSRNDFKRLRDACVKEIKRFENSKVFKCFQHGLIKNCANQFGIKGRNQKEQSMEIERMRKKVEEIHVED
jgi:hypothetical protein